MTPGQPPRISVIVPVLDEARRIGPQLAHLGRLCGLHEVIVVDGGSRDDTVDRARAAGNARLITAPRGRATQMNAGAAVASGEVLLFLHVDVMLPVDAATWIHGTLDDPAVVAGAFRTWTVSDEHEISAAFAALLHLADLRSRYSRRPYGDQALFVRAEVFRAVGGFAELAIMEDLDLSCRLGRLGRIRTVPARVRVSGRRFIARPVRATLMANIIPLAYRLGVDPEVLRRWYDASPATGSSPVDEASPVDDASR